MASSFHYAGLAQRRRSKEAPPAQKANDIGYGLEIEGSIEKTKPARAAIYEDLIEQSLEERAKKAQAQND